MYLSLSIYIYIYVGLILALWRAGGGVTVNVSPEDDSTILHYTIIY